jgi:uncharacterized protein YqeY
MEAGLRQKLDNELKQALKSRDTVRQSVIRLVLAAVNNAETARQAKLVSDWTNQGKSLEDINNAEIARQSKLEDGDILGVIAKEARQREESISAFKQGNRPDLVAQEEAELAILKSYLPQQMSRDEIVAEARQVIAEVGAQGPGDKGKVMPKLIAKLKGRADGREINAVVTELLK